MKRRYYARKRNRRKTSSKFFVILGVLIVALAAGIYLIVTALNNKPGNPLPPSETVQMTPPDGTDVLPTETPEPTQTPAPSIAAEALPHSTENTDPAKFGFETSIMDNGTEVGTYQRSEPIAFGSGDEYTAFEGLTGFRGNNYRNISSWGTAAISEEKLEMMKTKDTSRIGRWGGSGWTGQPLIVKWPADLRSKMTSLYEQFRSQEDFVEVIVSSLDGRIYFMDLATGEKTREFIEIGAPTKGTAALDPRGYPIIYVGQGLQSDGDANGCSDMYMRAFNLIDNSKIMEVGASSKDPFAYRGWQAYDSSPLIDANTDTLIWPGENGIIYTMHLNSSYNAETGAVTMDSDPVKVKYRYTSTRNKSSDEGAGGRWGIENSAVAWRNYLMFTDNAGMLQCIDLNTMSLVYANDLDDDSDVSMPLEEDPENNTFYLYTGCEYDELVRPLGSSGPAYARKIDGMTGEILWQRDFTVHSGSVDGGILASPVLGKEGTTLEGLVVYNVTQTVTTGSNTSKLVAMNTQTGETVWEYDMGVSGWSCSSPVAVYSDKTDEQGRTVAYIVQCEIGGTVALLRADSDTCTEVDKINVNEELGVEDSNNFEATPAVYENTIVVGSRSDHIFFITIK